MSHKGYNALWRRVQIKLEEQLATEDDLGKELSEFSFNEVASHYLHYLVALRDLDKCYDQIVHPQKRLTSETT